METRHLCAVEILLFHLLISDPLDSSYRGYVVRVISQMDSINEDLPRADHFRGEIFNGCNRPISVREWFSEYFLLRVTGFLQSFLYRTEIDLQIG